MDESATDWRRDPSWLALAPGKQAIALTRMDAVKRYLDGPRSASIADTMASRLNIGRSRFYGLCQAWREHRSPLALAPYSDPVTPQVPSIKRDRAIALHDSIAAALASTRDRTPSSIMQAVVASWDHNTAPPTRETLRRFVDKEIAREAGTTDDTLRREGTEIARRFGEVLVVDHTVVDIFVLRGATFQRLFLAVAVDLFTGAPVGHSAGLDPPSPETALAALGDAALTTEQWPGMPIRPRISLASAYGADWTRLRDSIRDAGLVLTGRRAPKLSFGAPTARLIGKTLGRLTLLARSGHSADRLTAGFDPKRHPVLTLEQARAVIRSNVNQAIAARTSAVCVTPLDLDLAERLDA